MAFLVAEDEALKTHLKGIEVATREGNKTVGVWFSLPQKEEREVRFPFMTVELVDIVKAAEREHRGYVTLGYTPDGVTPAVAGFVDKVEFPIPHDLFYQVTTYCRDAWTDRQLQRQLLSEYLPHRFGALDVEADDTIRDLQLLDWRSMDAIDVNRKRAFRKAYTVSVSSELIPSTVEAIQTVATVNIDLLHQLEPFIID